MLIIIFLLKLLLTCCETGYLYMNWCVFSIQSRKIYKNLTQMRFSFENLLQNIMFFVLKIADHSNVFYGKVKNKHVFFWFFSECFDIPFKLYASSFNRKYTDYMGAIASVNTSYLQKCDIEIRCFNIEIKCKIYRLSNSKQSKAKQTKCIIDTM